MKEENTSETMSFLSYKRTQCIPNYVKDMMSTIIDAGGKPYVVGGAVRDVFTGFEPKDWDLTSDLTPNEMIALLKEKDIPVVENLGNNFGVVVALPDKIHAVEIATFRSDAYDFHDAHRPSEVSFCKNIEDDLARRDFTINAMAMDIEGNIIDPFHGREDIAQKIIRPVGDAEKRYREDPLRMYRACRFVSQLGFDYVEDGNANSDVFVRKDFWKECNAKNLSVQRVRKEMEKLLEGYAPDKGLKLFMSSGLVDAPCLSKKNDSLSYITPFSSLTHLRHLSQNPKYHCYNAWKHTRIAVKEVPAIIMLRYTMLFHDSGKGLEGVRTFNSEGQPSDKGHEGYSSSIAQKALTSLGYSDSFVKNVVFCIKNHGDEQYLETANKTQIRRWLRRKALQCRTQKELVERVNNLSFVFQADLKAKGLSPVNMLRLSNLRNNMLVARDMAKHQMPVHSSDLEIRGDVVKEIVGNDKNLIKKAYRMLIDKVQLGQLLNSSNMLTSSLQRWAERNKNGQSLER